MSHFEFTGETHGPLKRIRATIDLPFHGVKAGDLGGWIESESNLQGLAWVADEAEVCGNAIACDNALLCDNAVACDNSQVSDYASVQNNAVLSGNAKVSDCAIVCDDAQLASRTSVSGTTVVSGNTQLCADAQVFSNRDFITLGPALSSDRYTTAFRTPVGVMVVTGCFFGTVDEFEAAIRSKHTGENLDQYLGFVSSIKGFFNEPL